MLIDCVSRPCFLMSENRSSFLRNKRAKRGKGAEKLKTDRIIDEIIKKRDELGMTNRQIVEASGLSRGTVERFFRQDPTQTVTMLTVNAIAEAVGYTIEGDAPDDAPPEQLASFYKERLRVMAAHYERRLREKNQWLRVLAIACGVLMLFIFGVLLYDALSPSAGWFRQQMEGPVSTAAQISR